MPPTTMMVKAFTVRLKPMVGSTGKLSTYITAATATVAEPIRLVLLLS